MPAEHIIDVALGERAYDIHIEKGIIAQSQGIISQFIGGRNGLIVTDSNVDELYYKKVVDVTASAGSKCEKFIFPAGEVSKTIGTLSEIYHKAVTCGVDRSSFIIALGGGVPGDIAGYAAASYMRGIDFIQIPTTILAMVDSSVGGKTAVDLPEGKNLVGAFWQPKLVLIDPEFINTLPDREVKCGLAEIVKYGMIMDRKLFELLEQNCEKLVDPDLDFYSKIIGICCRLKAEVVIEDEREGGRRAILNYGHTFGHAVEAVSGFDKYAHGEAVAIGMGMAADLGVTLGIFSKEELERQEELLQNLQLPCRASDCNPDNVYQAMFKDKKVQGGKLRLVLPKSIGEVEVMGGVEADLIAEAIRGRCD